LMSKTKTGYITRPTENQMTRTKPASRMSKFREKLAKAIRKPPQAPTRLRPPEVTPQVVRPTFSVETRSQRRGPAPVAPAKRSCTRRQAELESLFGSLSDLKDDKPATTVTASPRPRRPLQPHRTRRRVPPSSTDGGRRSVQGQTADAPTG